jgi:hypothetical protein
MTIAPRYLEYMDHFGATITLREAHADPARRDAVILRHDIDHDLDLALELAHHEHARGMRATYFLLHTAPYWNDERLAIKCRQLEAYGHEVALHVNALTEWMSGAVDDVDARLGELLGVLRDAGVTVSGVSAHGDRACYEHGFINYWMWRELRGDDPAAAQSGMSAEGIRVDDPQWQVPYPVDHRLRRADGAVFDLWSCSLADHGLDYDGAHVPTDRYWSDSGGSWSRTDDPLTADLSRGTHQVLVHPWWWRGPQRRVYVISTARAGSKWLANFVDTATSAAGRHEYTLNHRREGQEMVPDKRTNDDFVGLIEDRPRSAQLIRDSVAIARTLPRDLLEANVYLEPFLDQLRVMDPEAAIVHLHRDGRGVVRSILNRNWYDTPEDRRHRAIPVRRWSRLSQFERACWYYRYTNEQIAPHATLRIHFERMVSDLDYLTERLGALGIIVHPLLAEAVFGEAINVASSVTVPDYEHWPSRLRRTFDRICSPVHALLGYETREAPDHAEPSEDHPAEAPSVLMDLGPAELATRPHGASKVSCRAEAEGLEISVTTPGASPHLLLADGKWAKVSPNAGFPCHPDVYYRAEIDADVDAGARARIFAVFYGPGGKQVHRHQAWVLREGAPPATFAFAPAVGATHGAIAVHLGEQAAGTTVRLRRLRLTAIPFGHDYRLAPALSEATSCS